MAVLSDAEVRRLLKHLKQQINDTEKLAEIEDELRSDFGTEFIREPEFIELFQNNTITVHKNWKLEIISYTQMRMIQRGIGEDEISKIFKRFLDFCAASEILVIVGAYTILSKSENKNKQMTLRIDVDEINEKLNKAHTVTIFIGRGDTNETFEINLIN